MQIWQRLEYLEKESEEFGLAWPDALTILAQIESECQEIKAHLINNDTHSPEFKAEVGDLMHAVMSLSWFCDLNSLDVLNSSCDKFEGRLTAMKDIAAKRGLTQVKHLSFSELMKLWELAKQG